MSGPRLYAVVLIDYQSSDPFLNTPGKIAAIKQLVREHLRELIPTNADLVGRADHSGFYGLFLSVASAIQFSEKLQKEPSPMQINPKFIRA